MSHYSFSPLELPRELAAAQRISLFPATHAASVSLGRADANVWLQEIPKTCESDLDSPHALSPEGYCLFPSMYF